MVDLTCCMADLSAYILQHITKAPRRLYKPLGTQRLVRGVSLLPPTAASAAIAAATRRATAAYCAAAATKAPAPHWAAHADAAAHAAAHTHATAQGAAHAHAATHAAATHAAAPATRQHVADLQDGRRYKRRIRPAFGCRTSMISRGCLALDPACSNMTK